MKNLEGLNKFSSHWYTTSGEPRHDADLRVARKENLLPGVTTILGIMEKPFLSIWKQQQAILSALTLPRLPEESVDDFAKRVVIDAQETSKKACELGITVHEHIEHAIKGVHDIDVDPKIKDEVQKKIVSMCGACDVEKCVVNLEHGFAGTIDFSGIFGNKSTLIDFKTQGTKEGKCVFYPEWSYQLAAYNMIEKRDRCVSIIISISEPGLIKSKEWKKEEIEHATLVFKKTCELFYLIKKLELKK